MEDYGKDVSGKTKGAERVHKDTKQRITFSSKQAVRSQPTSALLLFWAEVNKSKFRAHLDQHLKSELQHTS
jgi:hypothetical protein